MAHKVQCDTTILGGLPVTAHGCVQPAEPDVGIFEAYIEDPHITWLSGASIPNSMDQRITPNEWERIRTELMEAMEE